jgi:hypothetical protein
VQGLHPVRRPERTELQLQGYRAIGPISLAGKRVFTRRLPLLESLHLPVLHEELIDVIGGDKPNR